MSKLLSRKIFKAAMVACVILAVVLTGCGQNAPSEPGQEGLSGTVTLAGSTSVQPLAEELGHTFMETNKGVRVEVAGGGSGAGIKAAQTKTADIGMASRELKAEETGIKAIVIAIDGIAVIVNPQNAIADLSKAQVKDIFTGKITNWKEIGGPNAQIVVVNREEGSGTRGAFEEIVLGKDAFINSAIIQNSTGGVREAVKQDVNAVGYISLGGLNATVKAVKVDGAVCSEENIKSQKYPIARPFNYLINETAAPTVVTQAFLDFVLSTEGQNVVKENGFIALE